MTETINWVSLLAYSWNADNDLKMCLSPTHLNEAIRWYHFKIPILKEIFYELAGSTKLTKVNGSSSYYCIVPNYEWSLLTTLNIDNSREIWLCTSSIQTHMYTGYLPEDDGQDPRLMWRSHQNHRWHNPTL